jgi:hypothetical protein
VLLGKVLQEKPKKQTIQVFRDTFLHPNTLNSPSFQNYATDGIAASLKQ